MGETGKSKNALRHDHHNAIKPNKKNNRHFWTWYTIKTIHTFRYISGVFESMHVCMSVRLSLCPANNGC